MSYTLSINSISAMWGTKRRRTKRMLSAVKQLGATVGVRSSVLVVGLVVMGTIVGVGSVAAECSQSGGDNVHLDVAGLSIGDDGNNQVDVSVASKGDCTKNDNDGVDADVKSEDSTEKNDNDAVDADVASDDSTGMNDNDRLDADVLSSETTGMNDNDRVEVNVISDQRAEKHDKDGAELEVPPSSTPGLATIYGVEILA